MESNKQPEEGIDDSVPDQALDLEDLDGPEVSDEVVRMTKERLREEVREDWPDATDVEIEAAVSEMEAFYLHTVRTGAINYRTAHDLGLRIALRLERIEKPMQQHG